MILIGDYRLGPLNSDEYLIYGKWPLVQACKHVKGLVVQEYVTEA